MVEVGDDEEEVPLLPLLPLLIEVEEVLGTTEPG